MHAYVILCQSVNFTKIVNYGVSFVEMTILPFFKTQLWDYLDQ